MLKFHDNDFLYSHALKFVYFSFFPKQFHIAEFMFLSVQDYLKSSRYKDHTNKTNTVVYTNIFEKSFYPYSFIIAR